MEGSHEPVKVTRNDREAADALAALQLSLPLFVVVNGVYERLSFAELAKASGVELSDLMGAIRRRFDNAPRTQTIVTSGGVIDLR